MILAKSGHIPKRAVGWWKTVNAVFASPIGAEIPKKHGLIKNFRNCPSQQKNEAAFPERRKAKRVVPWSKIVDHPAECRLCGIFLSLLRKKEPV